MLVFIALHILPSNPPKLIHLSFQRYPCPFEVKSKGPRREQDIHGNKKKEINSGNLVYLAEVANVY